MSRTGRVRVRLSAPLVVLMCLGLLVPAIPASQSGAAAPDAGHYLASQPQASPSSRIAFLREGQVWFMNVDGTGQRQVTRLDTEVDYIDWSPSGRYLLISHGAAGSYFFAGSAGDFPDAQVTILDTTTDGMETIHQGGQVTWAADADVLLLETRGSSDPNGRTMMLSRLDFDGTLSLIGSYQFRDQCGGPDGPGGVMLDLVLRQVVGPLIRYSYTFAHWYTRHDLVFVNPDCGEARILDLATGSTRLVPQTYWLTGDSNHLLVQDSTMQTAQAAGVYTVADGSVAGIESGRSYALSSNGQVYVTRAEYVGPSTFKPPFEEEWLINNDYVVNVFRTDLSGTSPALLASLDVYDTSVPSVTADAAWLLLGTVDNPSSIETAGTVSQDRFDRWAYAGHLRIVGIDTATGEVVELATNAYRPLAQPAGDVMQATSPEQAVAEPTTAPPVDPGTVDGGNRIAYIGDDGNIWLINPDGSDPVQITWDGTLENGLTTYGAPAWSHDGSMLTFAGGYQGSPHGIMLYANGTVTAVPGTENCRAPAFSADNLRLFFACDVYASYETPPDLGANPKVAFVTSSALDGSDLGIVVPYTSDGPGIRWGDGKSIHYAHSIDVNPADGSFIVTYHGFHKAGLHRFDENGRLLGSFAMLGANEAGLGPYHARLMPDGERVVATWCASGCWPNTGNLPVFDIVVLDLEGNVLEPWTMSFPDNSYTGIDASPDGTQLVSAFTPAASDMTRLVVFDGPQTWVEIGRGTYPAWQPGSAGATAPGSLPDQEDMSAETPQLVDPTEEAGVHEWPPIVPGEGHVVRDPVLEGGNLESHHTSAFTDVHRCEFVPEALLSIPRPLNPPPDHCIAVTGAVIDITGPNGETLGWCVTSEFGGCSVSVPADTPMTLSLDMSTVPHGVVAYENPRTVTIPSGIWDGIVTGFVLTPAG